MGSVSATKGVAIVGILMSALALAPPTYVYFMGKDYSTLMPYLPSLQRLLESQYERKIITATTMADQRQLLDDLAEHANLLAVSIGGVAVTNLFLDIVLLIGSCCKLRCFVLLWLIVMMLEILIMGCPCVIFFSLLGVYFTTYHQYLEAAAAFSSPTIIVVSAVVVWFTVLAGYNAMRKTLQSQAEEVDTESAEPLMPGEGGGQTNTSYNLGQYPQYYPHHTQQASYPLTAQQASYPPTAQQTGYPPTQHPTAPPQTTPTDKNNPNLYPTLPIT